MLNPNQERFCREYVLDLNAKAAAIRAGYSPKTAEVQGSRLLTNVNVKALIKELQDKLCEKLGLTAEMIVNELRALGFWNIQDFIDDNNEIKNLRSLDRSITRSVVGIKSKVTIIPGEKGKKATREVVTELKLVDKRGALVDLGKHLGIFEKDNSQKKDQITFQIKAKKPQ